MAVRLEPGSGLSTYNHKVSGHKHRDGQFAYWMEQQSIGREGVGPLPRVTELRLSLHARFSFIKPNLQTVALTTYVVHWCLASALVATSFLLKEQDVTIVSVWCWMNMFSYSMGYCKPAMKVGRNITFHV